MRLGARSVEHGDILDDECLELLLEIGLWVCDGATPWQTLVAATRHGTAVCGVGDDLGTVEVGGNPLEAVGNVRRRRLVFRDGRVISDERA